MRKGLTLIELLAVIITLGIIFGIALPKLSSVLVKSNDKLYSIMEKQLLEAGKKYVLEYKYEIEGLVDTGVGYITIEDLIMKGVINGPIIDPRTDESIPLDAIIMVVETSNGGYNYKFFNDYDDSGPVILFKPDSNITPVRSIRVQLTLADVSGIDITSLKYLWTDNSNLAPIESDFTLSFTENQVDSPIGITGEYYLWVLAKDNLGLTTIKRSNKFLFDNIPPVITRLGSSPVTINAGDSYVDAGATASDNIDGNITNRIVVTSDLNVSITGTYTIRYNVLDTAGNDATEVTRTVIVQITAPTTPGNFTNPVANIPGGTTITVSWGATSSWGSPSTNPNYRLEVQYDSGTWTLVGDTGTTASYLHTISSSASTIRYRVRAESGGGVSGWTYSATLNIVNTPPAVPGAFTGLPSTVPRLVTMTVSWGATSSWGSPSTSPNYRLEVQYNSGTWNLATNSATTSASITTSDATTVRFRVRAESDGGISDWTYSATLNMVSNTYTFTNASATARYGPNQTQVDTAYSGTSLQGLVTVNNGIQYITISYTGVYRIEVWGAQGGSGSYTGGLGARMRGDFNLTSGVTLAVLVGQQGTTRTSTCNSGGGGGSFAWNNAVTAEPLIAAGGGGGSGGGCSTAPLNAGTGPDGGTFGTGSTPGTGGNGATPGGAGWKTNGGNGYNGAGGGIRPLGWGTGGAGNTSSVGDGGFGGGAGASGEPCGNGGPGGGGGYSGGAGPSSGSSCGTGGGGGSYNAGTNQSNSAGARSGHGQVIVTIISIQ
jgi:type II secretory pathway pseudopilin PulG